MKICALTMVYRDHWALSQWYMHNAAHLGAENLFIIAHGPDKKIQKICPGAQVITIPRDDLDKFDGSRAKAMNDFQSILSETYDWIIRTDADELICLDPQHFTSFDALLSKRWGPAVFALGLEIAQLKGDSVIPNGDLALQHRSDAIFTGHYSKAWAVKRTTRMARHGVEVGKRRVNRMTFSMPKGVYLVHLKYADTKALKKANAHRIAVATSEGSAMPGAAWRNPNTADNRFLRKFKTFPHLDWHEAVAQAYTTISAAPVRDEDTGIVRAQSHRFQFKTTLPDWFKSAGSPQS